MKKLDQLTFTRFLAALTVVFYHGGGGVLPLYLFPLTPLLNSGPVSVSYFFVLSGFVMSLAYYKPGRRFDFSSYTTSRIARIIPVYWLSFLFVCFIYIDYILKIKWIKVLASLFLVQAWSPLYAQSFNIAAWSLSVEAFFYVIFPFLAIWFYRLPLRRLIWGSLLFWTLSQLIHFYLLRNSPDVRDNFLEFFPLFHLNSFLLGVVGGIWFVTESSKHDQNQKTNLALFALALGAVCYLLISATIKVNSLPSRYGFSLMNGVLAPFFLIIILALALDKTRLSKILSRRWLVLLGDASYALYILHVPTRWFLKNIFSDLTLPVDTKIFPTIYLAIVVPLSVLVFLFIEKPAREWLRINPRVIWMFLLDGMAVAVSIRLGFVLRLGLGENFDSYALTLNLILRAGLVIYPASFLILRLYSGQFAPSSFWRFLIPPALGVALGSLIVYLLLIFARNNEIVLAIPRSALIIAWSMMLVFLYGIRYLDRRLQGKAASR